MMVILECGMWVSYHNGRSSINKMSIFFGHKYSTTKDRMVSVSKGRTRSWSKS